MSRLPAQRKVEIRRHHADHEASVSIDGNGSAYHSMIRVEPAHPEAIAKNHLVGMTRLILLRKNVASEHGGDTERGEQAGGDLQAV